MRILYARIDPWTSQRFSQRNDSPLGESRCRRSNLRQHLSLYGYVPNHPRQSSWRRSGSQGERPRGRHANEHRVKVRQAPRRLPDRAFLEGLANPIFLMEVALDRSQKTHVHLRIRFLQPPRCARTGVRRGPGKFVDGRRAGGGCCTWPSLPSQHPSLGYSRSTPRKPSKMRASGRSDGPRSFRRQRSLMNGVDIAQRSAISGLTWNRSVTLAKWVCGRWRR